MRSGSSSFLFQRELGKHRWRVCVWGGRRSEQAHVRTEESVRSGVDTTLSEVVGGGGREGGQWRTCGPMVQWRPREWMDPEVIQTRCWASCCAGIPN